MSQRNTAIRYFSTGAMVAKFAIPSEHFVRIIGCQLFSPSIGNPVMLSSEMGNLSPQCGGQSRRTRYLLDKSPETILVTVPGMVNTKQIVAQLHRHLRKRSFYQDQVGCFSAYQQKGCSKVWFLWTSRRCPCAHD